MEGAARVFAGEYNGATLSVQGNDPGSPAWVVTPGGAWCRLLYLSGALTEVRESGDILRCRLADPTGAFDVVIGGHRTATAEILKKIPIPSFVTISGTAQYYRMSGGSVVSVRPDHVKQVDRGIRDRWVLETAEQTIGRLEQLLLAVEGKSMDERLLATVRHYALTKARLHEMVTMVESAVQGVEPAIIELPARIDTREIIMDIMRAGNNPRGIAVEEIIRQSELKGLTSDATLAAIESLIQDDECYQPQKGYVKPL